MNKINQNILIVLNSNKTFNLLLTNYLGKNENWAWARCQDSKSYNYCKQ